MSELAPHQRDAVARIRELLDRYGGAILADDVGLGKSFVAAAVAAEMQARACAVEVIVPASLVPQWRDTLSDFGVDARTNVMVMSHNYLRDKEYLRGLLGSGVPYLGMLGPRARTERLAGE